MGYHSSSLHPSHPAEEILVNVCDGMSDTRHANARGGQHNLVSVHSFRGVDLQPEDLPGVDERIADLMRKMVNIGGSVRQTVACLFARQESDGKIMCTNTNDTSLYVPCGIRHNPELVSPPSGAECLEVEERLNRGARVKPNDVISKLRDVGITLQLEDEWARWHARIIGLDHLTSETGEETPVEGYIVTRGLPPEVSGHIFHHHLGTDVVARITETGIDELSERDFRRVLRSTPPGYQIVPLRPRVVPTLLLLRRRNTLTLG